VFSPPNILLIKNFDFQRPGSVSKDKFIIVLLQIGPDAVIAPLTTSQIKFNELYKTTRCIIDVANNVHWYYIPKSIIIGQNGFRFIKDTYVHIHPSNLKKRSLSDLMARYEKIGAVEVKDKLTDAEYSDFLYCAYKSKHIPFGVKRLIEPIIAQIEKARNS